MTDTTRPAAADTVDPCGPALGEAPALSHALELLERIDALQAELVATVG